uniref:ATP synthase F0 subunit 8 n=1 Tax=Polyopes affinis TaxID=194519 RepID=UPI00202857EE|nr:ATP synthase F0 subunit 8 [Polyopes affinis]UQJ72536.1 ATP synthase F0 subunit 8 [Polyopes affinis]
MPQLDRIIIFSQIFWLFVIFVLIYIVLTHFFLPKFTKALKSRKQIIETNDVEILKLTSKIITKQLLLKQLLLKNLVTINTLLSHEFSTSNIVPKQNIHKIDIKISTVTRNVSLYCDVQLFNCIFFYPKSLNNTFKSV